MENQILDVLLGSLSAEEIQSLAEQKALINLIMIIEERLNQIDEKVFPKKKREEATKAQQLLILKHSGILEKIKDLTFPNADARNYFLSVLLKSDKDNIKKDLTTIDNDKDSPLRTQSNYSFLSGFFEKAGLKNISESVNKSLSEIKLKKIN